MFSLFSHISCFPFFFSIVELLCCKFVNGTRKLLSHWRQRRTFFQATFYSPENPSESLFQKTSCYQRLRGVPKMSGPPKPPNSPTLEELVNSMYANPIALMPQWMSINSDLFNEASSTTLDRLAYQLFNAPPPNPHNLPPWLLQPQLGLAPLGQLVGFLGYIPTTSQQAVIGLLPHLARFVPQEQFILIVHSFHSRNVLYSATITFSFLLLPRGLVLTRRSRIATMAVLVNTWDHRI